MMKRIILWLLEKLYAFTYEPLKMDKVNSKMIRPIHSLIIDGQQYYEFVNLADMPKSRMIHYKHLRQELIMGMDRDQINEYLDKMEAANNEGNTSLNGAMIYMLRDTINNCTPLEALYNMAALLYFDKDEDLKCFDADYNMRKIALFKQLPDQSFFFKRLLREGLKDCGVEMPGDIDHYLRQSTIKLKAFAGILSEARGKKT
jgi:hypothetical protein